MKTAWTTMADLREQMQRRWDKGELLADLAVPGDLFPLRLVLRGPSSSDLSERFDEVRAWAAALQQGAAAAAPGGCRLVMREVRHRVIGPNSLPDEAWVDTLDDALRLVGKARDARTLRTLLDMTLPRQPTLLPWLRRQPLRALGFADLWPRLLDVVGWLQAHPSPGVYLRQVDLPGIDTKFIEAQRGVLAELLDLALPAEAIDAATGAGAAQFAQRYGFRDKPLRVRLRFLDPVHLRPTAGPTADLGSVLGSDADVAISSLAFARLAPAVERVFITENEINFLTFPPCPSSLVVFGAGYGIDAVARAGWLQQCDVHYWGDLDTHGFAILDRLRVRLPHARSFLMDRATLQAHEAHWTREPQPTQRDLPGLNDAERRLYDDLRWRRLQDTPLRLEQERIAFGWVERAVAALAGVAPHPQG